MRSRDASAGSSSGETTSPLPLPDTDVVAAAWLDRPPAEPLQPRRAQAKAISRAMLALGAALLWFVPLGGALFLAAGSLGLAISSEPTSTDQ